MSHLVFLLEEPSAREMLNGLLPRLLPEYATFRCIVFEGKQDLEKNLVRRMRGYRVPGSRFVVVRDQDSGDCKTIKQNLISLCGEAGRPDVLVRIACREMESWYLGDLAAVEKGLGISKIVKHQRKIKFRAPDYIGSPSVELSRLTGGIYQKVSGSRSIGPFLNLLNRRSHSFGVFVDGIRKLAATDFPEKSGGDE